MRGDSLLFEPGGGGSDGVANASGAELWCVPSKWLGQSPGTMKGSSVTAILWWRSAGGVGSSSLGAIDEGCVEGECWVVLAVAELVVCEREDGTE